MSDVVRLLKADGTVDEIEAKAVAMFASLEGETDPATLSVSDIDADILLIEFTGAADGRGFSLAKAVLGKMAYQGKLYAAGCINPDQLSMALQTGFDGVLVPAERWADYGAEVWKAALSPIVKLSYASTRSQGLQSIWQLRHGTQS